MCGMVQIRLTEKKVAHKPNLCDTEFGKTKKHRREDVGARKDHITGMERAQIVMEMLSAKRPYGTVSQLEQKYEVSRQTIYKIAEKGKTLLIQGMEPGRHGARIEEKSVRVNREHVERSTVVLTEAGVSQRDISICLEELLETHLSSSWVNAHLAEVEKKAAAINQELKPIVEETLSGDEIYSNGKPNLLLVGNESMYIYALTRQPTCDGDTWGCVLLDSPQTAQFASDAGSGLAAGAEAAGGKVHQLDWDHLLRPLWGQASRLERQAYAALEALEARDALFEQAQTTKRLEKHLLVWERLRTEAEAALAKFDQFDHLARQVDAQFGLMDLETGEIRDPAAGVAVLRSIGKQLNQWSGRIYAKLSANLTNWADHLFAYHPILDQALAPLREQWGAPALHALSCLWQLEADAKRQSVPLIRRPALQSAWNHYLDTAVASLGLDPLQPALQAVRQVLNRSWRGSMLCECVNSLLRPVLAGRKNSDQGCLELFRFLHNVHCFPREKRAGHRPAELVGIILPSDPLTLLGLTPKCQSNSRCF
jgi:hypothetical protein